jgi:hypothetical protein
MKKMLMMFLITLATNSNATVETGNSFLENIQSKNSTIRQYLIGYVAGMYDAYERIDVSIRTCLGENVRMTQLVDSLEIYLKNNPQNRHHSMYVIYPIAVKSIFKCN